VEYLVVFTQSPPHLITIQLHSKYIKEPETFTESSLYSDDLISEVYADCIC
jgi:hypothetical protein